MRFNDGIPDFVVRIASDQDSPRLLHVERVGRVFDGSLDEFLELFIAQGGLVGELIDGSSGLEEVSSGSPPMRNFPPLGAGR